MQRKQLNRNIILKGKYNVKEKYTIPIKAEGKIRHPFVTAIVMKKHFQES